MERYVPITSRFIKGGDATSRHLMPEALCFLFDKAPPIGTVTGRKHFLRSELPRVDERRRPYKDLWFWVYPAFTNYIPQPQTHIIIIGHILLCSEDEDTPSMMARSIRLFLEIPGYRAQHYRELCRRVGHAP